MFKICRNKLHRSYIIIFKWLQTNLRKLLLSKVFDLYNINRFEYAKFNAFTLNTLFIVLVSTICVLAFEVD